MRIFGNILWMLCGGLFSAILWFGVGCLYCITLIGIPIGVQCFKIAGLTLNPFGQEIKSEGGPVSFLLNVWWFFFGGMELALANFIIGVLLCITIIGIPFGKQFFKLAALSLAPFGTEVQRVHFA
ncbi:YccF domain-containing protein [Butyrivibrio sp. WCD2001]|uniref:YccF domain-containing protein n=1 Tax=Butyrivibrio sp. WCD2001 TaxID=1280681 RepID=UPI00047B7F28|nr:YccF domain-containing protein [Butyrivibrio sp. WCD2001]